jgi:hypothetical protein
VTTNASKATDASAPALPVIDVHEVARERMVWALNDGEGQALMASILAEMGQSRLWSAEDLRAFGELLLRRGEPGDWLGSLLILHSVALRGRRS